MKPNKVRVAFIGAGNMANKVHYPSLSSLGNVDIVGICDIDSTRLEKTANRWSIDSRFTDYRAMVESVQPDAVYAIGQPHIMFDVWTWCLQNGCNLFIEKPMGLSLHQAQVLAYLAEENRAITQVGHQRRSSPLLRKVHAECMERGPITHAVCEFYKWEPAAMLGARDHVMDDSVHAIDTLRWICGGEAVSVEGWCRYIGTPDVNWVCATIFFDNGSVGMLLNSWISGRRIFRVEMHAYGIAVDADLEGQAFVYAEGDCSGKYYEATEVAGSSELYIYGGFQAKTAEFVDSVLSGSERTSSPFRDCLKTMELAEMILAQSLCSSSKSWQR